MTRVNAFGISGPTYASPLTRRSFLSLSLFIFSDSQTFTFNFSTPSKSTTTPAITIPHHVFQPEQQGHVRSRHAEESRRQRPACPDQTAKSKTCSAAPRKTTVHVWPTSFTNNELMKLREFCSAGCAQYGEDGLEDAGVFEQMETFVSAAEKQSDAYANCP